MFRASPASLPQAVATEPPSTADQTHGAETHHGLAWMVSGRDGKSASNLAFDPVGPTPRPPPIAQPPPLAKLEAALGRERLAYLSGGAGKGPLQALINGGFVDSFIEYVHLFGPSLHAKDGRDFTSFMNHPLGSLRQYKESVPTIHSPHRVAPGVLQALSKNFQDHSKKRPLVIVVVSALDLDGSHHHNDSLGSLATQNQNLVLAIEAGETRKNVIEALSQLAVQYGQDDRIQDIVFVGHGGPSRFDLAGRERFEDWTTRGNDWLHEGNVRVGNIDINPSWHSLSVKEEHETKLFVRRLLQLLDTRWGAATPRIVFDASLSGSENPSEEYRAGSARYPRGLEDLIRDYSGNDVNLLAGYGREPGSMMVDASGRPTTAAAPARRR